MYKLTTIFLFSLALLGCGEEKVHSVEYYIENPDDMNATLDKCKNIEDRATNNNCLNATKAKAKNFSNSMFGEGVKFE